MRQRIIGFDVAKAMNTTIFGRCMTGKKYKAQPLCKNQICQVHNKVRELTVADPSRNTKHKNDPVFKTLSERLDELRLNRDRFDSKY
jgi:hypothetical protein